VAGDDSHVPLLGFSTAIVRPQVLHSATPQGNKLMMQQANLKKYMGHSVSEKNMTPPDFLQIR
jgi:hypothetical protein